MSRRQTDSVRQNSIVTKHLIVRGSWPIHNQLVRRASEQIAQPMTCVVTKELGESLLVDNRHCGRLDLGIALVRAWLDIVTRACACSDSTSHHNNVHACGHDTRKSVLRLAITTVRTSFKASVAVSFAARQTIVMKATRQCLVSQSRAYSRVKSDELPPIPVL